MIAYNNSPGAASPAAATAPSGYRVWRSSIHLCHVHHPQLPPASATNTEAPAGTTLIHVRWLWSPLPQHPLDALAVSCYCSILLLQYPAPGPVAFPSSAAASAPAGELPIGQQPSVDGRKCGGPCWRHPTEPLLVSPGPYAPLA